jgi:hypothetical protein
VLQADIEKYTATAEKLGQEIVVHDEDISVWTGDKEATANVRVMEKADYDKMHKDYSESVDALERAIAVLKKQSHDRKQAPAEAEPESFAQVSSLTRLELVPANVKRTIQAFLQQDPPAPASASAPRRPTATSSSRAAWSACSRSSSTSSSSSAPPSRRRRWRRCTTSR